MQQHIQIYRDSRTPVGLINICNIEEIWLNEACCSVTIRYRSPNGNLIDHEEYYDALRVARMRYTEIKQDILDNKHACSEITFRSSMKERKKQMEASE